MVGGSNVNNPEYAILEFRFVVPDTIVHMPSVSAKPGGGWPQFVQLSYHTDGANAAIPNDPIPLVVELLQGHAGTKQLIRVEFG